MKSLDELKELGVRLFCKSDVEKTTMNNLLQCAYNNGQMDEMKKSLGILEALKADRDNLPWGDGS